MSSPILYLCQAYSKYEQVPRDAYDMHDAYAFAINTYRELIGMGFDVFSPIMYTHPFHLAMRQPNIDYVAHDLKMIEGLLKYDYTLSNEDFCGCDGHFQKYHGGFPCGAENWKGCKVNGYDSGVVCVFADDCIICIPCTDLDHASECFDGDHQKCKYSKWSVDPTKSKGAKAEYDFAHAHHIKCIRLSELLEKKKIEECEPI